LENESPEGIVHMQISTIGLDIGCSASKARDEVRRLASAGIVRATPGPHGTLLELKPVAKLN
jgi:hypothetical protein